VQRVLKEGFDPGKDQQQIGKMPHTKRGAPLVREVKRCGDTSGARKRMNSLLPSAATMKIAGKFLWRKRKKGLPERGFTGECTAGNGVPGGSLPSR